MMLIICILYLCILYSIFYLSFFKFVFYFLYFIYMITGKALFIAPRGRTFEEFKQESLGHGWPSFRDEEVGGVWCGEV